MLSSCCPSLVMSMFRTPEYVTYMLCTFEWWPTLSSSFYDKPFVISSANHTIRFRARIECNSMRIRNRGKRLFTTQLYEFKKSYESKRMKELTVNTPNTEHLGSYAHIVNGSLDATVSNLSASHCTLLARPPCVIDGSRLFAQCIDVNSTMVSACFRGITQNLAHVP